MQVLVVWVQGVHVSFLHGSFVNACHVGGEYPTTSSESDSLTPNRTLLHDWCLFARVLGHGNLRGSTLDINQCCSRLSGRRLFELLLELVGLETGGG